MDNKLNEFELSEDSLDSVSGGKLFGGLLSSKVKCPFCGALFLKEDIEQHKTQCSSRTRIC